MNEIIIKEPLFKKLTKEEAAYKNYYSIAVQYTTPLSFEQWKKEVKTEKHTC